MDTSTAVNEAWIAQNIKGDRQVAFGSEEYFALAKDSEARQFLQSDVNVTFEHGGEVIAVQEGGVTNNANTAAITQHANFSVFDLFAWIQQVLQDVLR